MKYIIKKILKEETESDEEKLILKGINLAVNSLKSDFPFIVTFCYCLCLSH